MNYSKIYSLVNYSKITIKKTGYTLCFIMKQCFKRFYIRYINETFKENMFHTPIMVDRYRKTKKNKMK